MNDHDLKIIRNAKHGKLEDIRYIIKINGITVMITDDIGQFKDRLDWALWALI